MKMKKIIMILSFTLVAMTVGYSQVLITLKSGKEIKAKILEVGKFEVKYKDFSNQSGPTFIAEQSDISMIRYEDGSIAVAADDKETDEDTSRTTGHDLYTRGQFDASRFYRAKFTGTFLVTALLNPLLGLIPAITCSSNPPKEYNLGYPSSNLMNNQDYHKGYATKAHRMKKTKVWVNYIVGTCVYITAIAVIAASGQ